MSVPPVTAATPSLTDPSLTNPALTNPSLTSPTGATAGLTAPTAAANPALTSPTGATAGLTAPTAAANPALTSPIGATPGLTGAPGEVPITAPIGQDPGLGGTYPILGDPSLAAAPASTGSGGLVSDLSNAVTQLGGGQAMDLLKGVLMPSIMQAVKSGATPPAPAPGG
jgi:hypothetical protein